MIVPNRWQGHKCEISLRNQGRNSCPVDYAGVPFLDHLTFPDIEDYEWEGMYQSQDKHGIAGPMMIDLSS